MRCPPVPLDAVNSAVVRIVSGVLSAQREDVSPPSFWATCFQQRFSVRLAEIVMIHLPSDKEQVCTVHVCTCVLVTFTCKCAIRAGQV